MFLALRQAIIQGASVPLAPSVLGAFLRGLLELCLDQRVHRCILLCQLRLKGKQVGLEVVDALKVFRLHVLSGFLSGSFFSDLARNEPLQSLDLLG